VELGHRLAGERGGQRVLAYDLAAVGGVTLVPMLAMQLKAPIASPRAMIVWRCEFA
jgi:hypothetical protein